MKELIGEKLSYNSYGRPLKLEYALSDEYICAEVGGCLLCTDTERDIDHDGNIVLVWPDKKVSHIGIIPMTEDGRPARVHLSGSTLTVEWVEFADDHFRKPYVESREYDVTPTRALRKKTELLYLSAELNKKFKGLIYHSYRNTFESSVRKQNGSVGLLLVGSIRKISPKQLRPKSEEYFKCFVDCTDQTAPVFDGSLEVFKAINPSHPNKAEEQFKEALTDGLRDFNFDFITEEPSNELDEI